MGALAKNKLEMFPEHMSGPGPGIVFFFFWEGEQKCRTQRYMDSGSRL